ncbi:MAG: hypothetical protein ABI401_15975 [Candidatus Dormibacter sp.]
MTPRRRDAGQALLEQAGADLARFLKQSTRIRRQVGKVARSTAQQAVVKGAGTLRRQADDLQAGLKKLSARLATLEHGNAASPKAPAPRAAAPRKRSAPTARTRRPARPKKAA